jgi:hypothetical protein
MNAAFLDKTNFNKSTYVIRERGRNAEMNGIYYYRLHLDIELQKLFDLYKSFFMVNYMNISLLKSIVNNLFKNITVMSDFFKCFRLTKLFSHSLRKLCIRLNILYIPPSYNNGQ